VLLERIGKGAMGEVYRARREGDDRPLAVKRMAPEVAANPVLRRRFEQECSAAVRLRHPHVVEGIDFGVEEGRPYLVMEYVDGESLAERVARSGPLPPPEVLRLAYEIGSALQAAHDADLIHRDVKPENVLIDRSGRSKLADLGLVKDLQAEEALTRSGAWLGTVAYMAPEQFGDARHVDRRCDVYGLAATLYFALVGASPFPQEGALTALGKKLANEFVPPRRHGASIGAAFDAAVRQALDAEPQKRPASCSEFVRLLGEAEEADAEGQQADEPERRGARRFPVAVQAACAAISGGREWDAEVKDVSLTGIRLRISRRFEPSAVLSMRVKDEKSGDWSRHVARVRWVRQAQAGWEIGCDFARPLAESDLDVFLQHAPRTVHVQQRDEDTRPETSP
jgi:serine/threonine protein kinase